MPKKDETLAKGTPQEKEIFWEVMKHMSMAKQDLDSRRQDWNKKDELFRSHINNNNWPYSAKVFDPRIFTAIFEKGARLLANKLKGKMIPREGGDVVGAKINNALLDFQWDEAERVEEEPMLAKWARMDQNARKYGASFALVPWHFEERKNGKKEFTWFDGPTFTPWNNRDVLHNPSYSHIKNWIQLRGYVTLDELTDVNNAARKAPVYKNLHLVKDVLADQNTGGGDQRSKNWASRNLSIKGLQDFLGRDPVFKTIELITEYRNDRWVTFAPRLGLILRDIPNPYNHGRIPVVMLKYYPVDEDIYGLSEIEPVEKIQKAINALVCQYLDAINMNLYNPIKVRTAAVQLHTLEFGPGKKWLMNDPSSDVLPYETSTAGIAEFTSTYRFLVGAMQEALGETSAATSQLNPGEGERTATEIKETALQRNVRDNFNQLFLGEALKDQMQLWFLMNKQFLFDDPNEKHQILRVVGQDAISGLEREGLGDRELTGENIDALTSDEGIKEGLTVEDVAQPSFPVDVEGEAVPKMLVEEGGARLIIEPEDLSGNYDYMPDVRAMAVPDGQQVQALTQMVTQAKDPATVQIRASQGSELLLADLEQDLFKLLGMKDAEKYYRKVEGGVQDGQVQPIGIGEGGPAARGATNGAPGGAGVEGSPQALPGG